MCVISSQPDHTLHEVELLLEVVEVLQSTSVPPVQLGHQLSLTAGSLKLNLSVYQKHDSSKCQYEQSAIMQRDHLTLLLAVLTFEL